MRKHLVEEISGACGLSSILAYLVDLDGTLADTGTVNYLAYAAALQEVGVFFDRNQFDREALGRNWRQFLPAILSRYGSGADPSAVANRKGELYEDLADRINFNEALVLLLRNKAANIKIALVTSASAKNVETVFSRRPEIKRLFDVIITGDDVSRHKPDPEGYAIAARLLGVAAERCIVFEDSDIGVEAGCRFGGRVLRICF
jgi:beta-phosphoglucomutase